MSDRSKLFLIGALGHIIGLLVDFFITGQVDKMGPIIVVLLVTFASGPFLLCILFFSWKMEFSNLNAAKLFFWGLVPTVIAVMPYGLKGF